MRGGSLSTWKRTKTSRMDRRSRGHKRDRKGKQQGNARDLAAELSVANVFHQCAV
jgi:hypothetical protein